MLKHSPLAAKNNEASECSAKKDRARTCCEVQGYLERNQAVQRRFHAKTNQAHKQPNLGEDIAVNKTKVTKTACVCVCVCVHRILRLRSPQWCRSCSPRRFRRLARRLPFLRERADEKGCAKSCEGVRQADRKSPAQIGRFDSEPKLICPDNFERWRHR